MRRLAFFGGLVLAAIALMFWLGARTDGPGLVPAATSAADVTEAGEIVAPRSPDPVEVIGTPKETATSRSPVVGESLASGRRVRGKVIVPEGATLDDIRVALVLLDGMAAPERTVEVARPRPDGTFELTADEAGEHRVVAFTSEEALKECRNALRPTSIEIVIDAQDVTLPEPLEMSERELISGWLVAENGSLPIRSALHARRKSLAFGERVGPLEWDGMTFEYLRACTSLDEADAFRFSGLGPSEYELWCDPGTSGEVPLNWRSFGLSRQALFAPTEGARLSLGFGLLSCEVRSAGQPLEGAQVLVTTNTRMDVTTLEKGNRIAIAFGAKEEQLDLVFEKQGFTRRAMTLDPRSYRIDEWLVVELEEVPRASLELVLSGAGVETVEITFEPAGETAPQGFVSDLLESFRSHRLQVQAGHVLVAGIAPGGYHVTVEAADDPRGRLDLTYVVPRSFEVELVAGQLLTYPMELVQGSRLSIPPVNDWASALDPEKSVHYRLRDSSGTPLKMDAAHFFGNGGVGLSGDVLSKSVVCELFPTLPPGPYTLEIFQGDPAGVPAYTFPVMLEAGRTTTLVVP